jgi:DNA polymerase
MITIYPDFETRSKVDLKKTGQSVYSRDPSTEVMCLCWSFDDDYPLLWTPEYDEGIEELFEAIKAGDYKLVAHNASFEIAIWNNICVPRLGWPAVPANKWHCTMAKLSALSLPRGLDKAGTVLGLPQLKDDKGHKLMMRMCKPRKATKLDVSEWHEQSEQLEKLYGYCRRDVVVQRLIDKKLPDLSERERLVWLFDQRVNNRGIPIDTETVDHALVIESKYKETLLNELCEVSSGEITTADQTKRMIKFANERGLNIDNVKAETLEQELGSRRDSVPECVYRVLEIRQELSNASIAKYHSMKRRADTDGRIRGSHIYGGAGPGRWTSEGVQTQNLIRGDIPKDEIDIAIRTIHTESLQQAELLFDFAPRLLTGCLRSMVVAGEGKRLLICDFASIEARVLAWLARQSDLIEDFRQGVDAYRKMACKIYKMPERVAADDDYWGTEEGKLRRFFGKQAVLGLGYAMGAQRFVDQCAQHGIVIDMKFAQEVVDIYRESYSRISQWWWNLKDAAVETVESGTPSFANASQFRMDGRFLKTTLPCGRDIAYSDPFTRMETWYTRSREKRVSPSLFYYSYKKGQWIETKTHGGKLAENIVQGTSRDFLVEAMVRCEAAGYPVFAHVHDEVVCEVEDDFGSVQELEDILSLVPKWGRGCPIAAEGFESKRYRK